MVFIALTIPKISIISIDKNTGIGSKIGITAIAILAGFSTEQVIERMRKISKALFGDEGDKGKKGYSSN